MCGWLAPRTGHRLQLTHVEAVFLHRDMHPVGDVRVGVTMPTQS